MLRRLMIYVAAASFWLLWNSITGNTYSLPSRSSVEVPFHAEDLRFGYSNSSSKYQVLQDSTANTKLGLYARAAKIYF
jgi:hypothetical protein